MEPHGPKVIERTIHHQDFEPTGTIELLRAVNLLDTMLKVSPFVKTVVLESYPNLTKGIRDPTSPNFQTVYVRGHKFTFSPGVINSYLRCLDPTEPIPHPTI